MDDFIEKEYITEVMLSLFISPIGINEILNLRNRISEEKVQKLIEGEKITTELSLLKLQKKTFWIVFYIGLIGGVCGIISLIMQLKEKTVIEKLYIPVDSQGKTVSPLPQTFQHN